jgi:predicted nucleic acid-binding protein
LKKAWGVYDRWLRDPKVEFRQELEEVGRLFRHATERISHTPAPKALGDCYLLAFSQASNAILVTLDAGLSRLARKMNQDTVLLT